MLLFHFLWKGRKRKLEEEKQVKQALPVELLFLMGKEEFSQEPVSTPLIAESKHERPSKARRMGLEATAAKHSESKESAWNGIDTNLLWKINPEQFIRDFRHRECTNMISTKVSKKFIL